MKKNKVYTPEELKKMEQAVETVDFSAVVARMAGKPLTSEQQKQCEEFDSLYDQLHANTDKEDS